MSDFNPYESPQAIEPTRSLGRMAKRAAFASGHGRAVCAMILLGIMAILHVGMTVNDYLDYTLAARVVRDTDLRTQVVQELRAAQVRDRAVAVGWLSMWIATAVVFLMWVHRVYRNLPALGARGLEFTPAFAVGWFFAPLANLVVPYTVMAEIWRNSNPEGIGIAARATSAALVAWWWIALVVGGVFGWMIALCARTIPVYEFAQSGFQLVALGAVRNAIGVAAAVLAILVVSRIDRNQAERFVKIGGQAEGDAAI